MKRSRECAKLSVWRYIHVLLQLRFIRSIQIRVLPAVRRKSPSSIHRLYRSVAESVSVGHKCHTVVSGSLFWVSFFPCTVFLSTRCVPPTRFPDTKLASARRCRLRRGLRRPTPDFKGSACPCAHLWLPISDMFEKDVSTWF